METTDAEPGLRSSSGGASADADAPNGSADRPPVSLGDIVAPALGMYAGQLLASYSLQLWIWSLAAMGSSLLLLALRFRWRRPSAFLDALQIGIGLFIGLPLALNAANLKYTASPWSMILLWVLSCTIVITAVSHFRRQPIRLGLSERRPLDRWDALTIVLLVAGALILRLPALEMIPWGFEPDEGTLAQFPLHAAMGAARDPFTTGWATHPTLQFFLNSLWLPITGRSFTTMRLPSVFMGTLAVIAVYLFARAAFGRRIAILAGLLVVSSDVAVHFSRVGVNNISDVLFMAWTLAGLWAAGSTGHPLAYAAAGVGLGLGQYYYFGARAIPFVVAAQLLAWLLADRRGVVRAWHLLLGFLLVTLVVVEPLFGDWLRQPAGFSQHMDLTIPFSSSVEEVAARYGTTPAQLWWRHARDTLLIITILPDRGTFYNPKQAMLNPLHVPFFLAGLLVLLSRFRRPLSQGMLAWLVIVLTLGSFLMTDPADFHRLLGLVPLLITTTAVGVDAAANAVVDALRPLKALRRFKLGSRVSQTIALGVTLVLCAATINYYFRVYNVRESFKSPNQEAVTIAALEYEKAAGQGLFLLCTQDTVDAQGVVGHPPIQYIAGGAFKGCVPQVLAEIGDQRPINFYFLPDRFADIPGIMAAFPGGITQEYQRRSDGSHILTRYAVAAAP